MVFRGALLAGPSHLDKNLAPWEALAAAPGGPLRAGYLAGALGGHDFGAAPDIAWGSPAWLVWRTLAPALGSARAFSLLFPLLLGLTAWFAWAHLRTLGLRQRAAVLGALVVAGNELMLETIGAIGVLGTVAMVSATAWAGERLARAPSSGRLALTALAVGAALIGGHQQYAAFGLAGALGLTALRLVQLQGPRALAWAVAAGGLGAGLAAGVLLPAVLLLEQSSRGAVQVGELLAEEGIFLDGPMLRGLVSLSAELRQGDAVELDPIYVGAVPVLLALLGLSSHRRALAAGGGGVALGLLLLSHPATGLLEALLGTGLPGLSLFKTAEGRLLLLFSAVGLLGALGIERLEQLLGRRGPAVAWALIGLAAVGLVRMRVLVDGEVIAENRVSVDQIAELRRPEAWAPSGERRYYLHRDRSLDELENTALLWDRQELSGRAVLPPRRWLRFVHARADVPALEQRPPDRPEQGFLAHPGLVGVAALDTVVLPARLDHPPAGAGWRRSVRGARVHYSRDPQPRWALQKDVSAVEDEAAALAALRARRSEQGPLLVEGISAEAAAGGGSGTGSLVAEAPTRLELRVQATGSLWVVYRRPWSPGWTATVDGAPTSVYPADVMSLAMRVPEGEHTIVFAYRTPGRLEGLAISGLSALACLGLGLLGWRRRRPSAPMLSPP